MKNRLVEVAVPLPIPSTFTYAAPPLLEPEVEPGRRVLVPFGRKNIIGLTVGLDPTPPPNTQIKEIRQVLDDKPLLSDSLLQLGRWMAAYYFGPPGEALRVMLPPGLLPKDADRKASRHFWPTRRLLSVTSLSADPGQLPPRQQSAFEKLQGCRLPIPLSLFSKQTGISGQTVRALAAKNVLQIEERAIRRSPWTDLDRLNKDLSVTRHPLNPDQQEAVSAIRRYIDTGNFASMLLHGVTGSGKTEVYLNSIEHALSQDLSALMLVPEIGLTPQAAQAFRGWFGAKVAVLHSALGEGERFDEWRRIRSGECRVVLGTRSAVFAPVVDLGIIILDEEHDGSYKQDEQPRYHARETALKRARLEGATVVMGSATPQLETFHRAAREKRHGYRSLPQRVQERPLPTVHIVDMRTEFQQRGFGGVISKALEQAIEERLERREQTLILLNRRGYAPVLLCRSCGAVEECLHCSISLTYHRRQERLICHYCGYARSRPARCRHCGKEYLYFWGEGTEKIQDLLREKFPYARVDRMDRDTVGRKGAYQRILGQFSQGKTDILVGTQMIAKGHDFPQVTLVGVLAADQGLRLADFRAAERTFQLLTQVSGRAGRGELAGDVFIQTFYPNHYSLKYACVQDYEAFFEHESEFRKNFRYPPFTLLAKILIQDPDLDRCRETAESIGRSLLEHRESLSSPSRMRILGPAAAALEKLRNEYRMQILIKTVSRSDLQKVLTASRKDWLEAKLKSRRINIDIDPLSLL